MLIAVGRWLTGGGWVVVSGEVVHTAKYKPTGRVDKGGKWLTKDTETTPYLSTAQDG